MREPGCLPDRDGCFVDCSGALAEVFRTVASPGASSARGLPDARPTIVEDPDEEGVDEREAVAEAPPVFTAAPGHRGRPWPGALSLIHI